MLKKLICSYLNEENETIFEQNLDRLFNDRWNMYQDLFWQFTGSGASKEVLGILFKHFAKQTPSVYWQLNLDMEIKDKNEKSKQLVWTATVNKNIFAQIKIKVINEKIACICYHEMVE